ncbi:hypothetical protein PUNSTDRAFT_54938 [Punctularia strigosozonata HHB-11173 SS5]|uniref:uncharacterized protein n=1 Tax=Punctularia strigosozonata (strain HHB-11173) TaxID=741275 RepID=UPI00044186F5|nr:uncharacterized protein PUNSTDRAFT_54938 [Punctularia strigosozonata HHB-11173 SS5]EIN05566.1 hypothetical protein PUNSTDRAFT_54938 [Punctularia strigosozonata HHB-11173 SS5]
MGRSCDRQGSDIGKVCLETAWTTLPLDLVFPPPQSMELGSTSPAFVRPDYRQLWAGRQIGVIGVLSDEPQAPRVVKGSRVAVSLQYCVAGHRSLTYAPRDLLSQWIDIIPISTLILYTGVHHNRRSITKDNLDLVYLPERSSCCQRDVCLIQ